MLCFHNLPAAYDESNNCFRCDVQHGSKCNYYSPCEKQDETVSQRASGVCRCGNLLAIKQRKQPCVGAFCGCMYNTCDEFTVVPTKVQPPVTETAARSEAEDRITIPLAHLIRRGMVLRKDSWPANAISASLLERDLMGIEYVVRDDKGNDNFGGGVFN